MTHLRKRIKTIIKSFVKSAFSMNFISFFITIYDKLVGYTTRCTIEIINNIYDSIEQNDGIILLIWHGRALMLPHFWKNNSDLYALVSLHRDGRMIAGLLERFGIKTIGGSTNENAVGSAVTLLRTIKKKASICIIPDGPRGPRMFLGKSPLYFAQKTGKPIVCAS